MDDAGPASMWEEEIAAYEQADRLRPPPTRAVVFTGSSSIRMWPHIDRDFAPLRVVPRGFGGAHVNALCIYAPRIVLAYAPRAVVIYGGENDLEEGTGKTPESVLADMHALLALIEGADPATRCYLLSIKPSPARAGRWPHARRLNTGLRRLCQTRSTRSYVDVASPMLREPTERRLRYFLEDGLHLSSAGYGLWCGILRPMLLHDLGA